MDNAFNGWWLPINISTHGAGIDRLIVTLHWFMALLFVGWLLYFLYCLVRFRSGAQPKADLSQKHFKLPTYLEIGIVFVEAALLLFVASPIWAKVKNEFPNPAEAVTVRVVAEQFAWNIHYPGRDGKFGRTDIKNMDGTNPVGVDRTDPNGVDDLVTINELKVPVNKPVIVQLSSKDVIHSFGIPVMRVKQDAIPGMDIPIWFQATQTGNFEIACAQLCGLGHYRMRGAFQVIAPEEFQAWLDEQHKAVLEEQGLPAEGGAPAAPTTAAPVESAPGAPTTTPDTNATTESHEE
jgi:cytochrome c oxidase subunit II